MGQLHLILGGARSGKSTFGQQLAEQLGGDAVLFVATAEAGDEDMAARIAAHRRSRPAAWQTLEAPRHVGRRLAELRPKQSVVVVDCLTLLVSNAILSSGDEPDPAQAESLVLAEVKELIAACDSLTATSIVITNEVGLGLVPPNPLGRLYRDLLGKANQALATRAERVYLLVAGIPVDVKRLAAEVNAAGSQARAIFRDSGRAPARESR